MFTLIALGTGVAWLYSVVATLAPGLFPPALPRRRRHDARSISRRPPSSSCWCCWARCSSCAPATRTGGAIRALLGLAPRTAHAVGADGSDEDVALDADRGRRPPARAAGREGAGRRRGRSKARARSTNRPSPASRCRSPRRAGARVIGGTVNTAGAFVMRAEQVGARHHAGAHRQDGGRGAAQPRADPAPGRPVAGWFVPAVIAVAVLAFVAWMVWGPAPRLRLCAARGGVGADHRLPLRARPGDADVDHGRRRPRRAMPAS